MKRLFVVFVLAGLLGFQFFGNVRPVEAATTLVVTADRTPGTYYMDYSPVVNLKSYPGSVIVYTTNGTIPKAKMFTNNTLWITNGKRYTGSITLSGAMTIKAISLYKWYIPQSSVYTFSYKINKTAPLITSGANGIYYLPWEKGYSHYVSRAGSDHANQIDFVMSKGTPVLAARSGYIRKIVETYTRYGCTDSLLNYANMVVIEDTTTGEWSYYLHLDTNSVPDSLYVGKYVKRGTLIGKAGNIGKTCGSNGGYHLHFEVRRSGKVVIPFFADVQGGYVKSYKTYTKNAEIRY